MANVVNDTTNIMKNVTHGGSTYTANMLDPEVLADMIQAKLDAKLKMTPYAKIDETLVGQPGTTITVPAWEYQGEAEVVAEGDAIPYKKLAYNTKTATIKKIGQGSEITDEALLSGYGDPQGAIANQLSLAVAEKIESDVFDEAVNATKYVYDGTAGIISYNGIVNAIDLFNEEEDSEKVMFVNPKQMTQLRLDSNFISADKYTGRVVETGEVGRIAGVVVVKSKRVKLGYGTATSETTGALKIVASGATSGQINIDDVDKALVFNSSTGARVTNYAANDYIVKLGYINPILKLNQDNETEDELPAITIYKKRDAQLESARDIDHKTTKWTIDQHYVAKATNDSKIVVARFADVASA